MQQLQVPSAGSPLANGHKDSTGSASPPDFDFNLPCRYFKSSFARSLSLNNSSSGNCFKSLDFVPGSDHLSPQHHGTAATAAPPLMPRTLRMTAIQGHDEEVVGMNNNNNNNTKINHNHKIDDGVEKPPALPARRPQMQQQQQQMLQKQHLHQQQQQHHQHHHHHHHQQQHQQLQIPLTQFRSDGPQRRSSIATTTLMAPPPQQPPPTPQSAAAAVVAALGQPPAATTRTTINHQAANVGGNNNNNNGSNQTSQQAPTVGGGGSFLRRTMWPLENLEQDFNFQCRLSPDDEDEIQLATTTTSGRMTADDAIGLGSAAATPPTAPTPATRQPQPQPTENVQHRLHPAYDHAPDAVSGGLMNVEAVLLQNQVDTLKWQLKQVETSREMYRAVMEEVARFLDRYHSQQLQKRVQEQQELLHHQQQLQQQQQQLEQQQQQSVVDKPKSNRCTLSLGLSLGGHSDQIARSKSLHHVNGGGGDKLADHDDDSGHQLAVPVSAYMRTRSSTNLIEPRTPHELSTDSYSAFKDFTWRRSPKKSKDSSRSRLHVDESEEKLNEEAFRLSRTIHNLLNTSTQQPDLTHHRNSMVSLSGVSTASSSMQAASGNNPSGRHCMGRKPVLGRCESVASSTASSPGPIIILEHAGPSNPSGANLASGGVGNGAAATVDKELLFLRSANMRDSRLSLRSCTDSSVHSTMSSAASSASSTSSSSSSSKVETDEEVATVLHPYRLNGSGGGSGASSSSTSEAKMSPNRAFGSGTEDESGFSSISSFHDVGVPLSSTLLSTAAITGRQLGTMEDSSGGGRAEESSPRGGGGSESRVNATLKPGDAMAHHPNNVVGVPLWEPHHHQHTHTHPHQQQQQPANGSALAKTYRNTAKFQQRFSTLSNEDSATVLWV